jgi:xylulokinase
VSDGPRWYLAIDLGTSGLKVGAVTPLGEILAHAYEPIETTYLAGGGAIQNVEQWWMGIVKCVKTILKSGTVQGNACAGIGTTGQWASTVPVMSSGESAGPVLLWSDDRGGEWSRNVVGGPVNFSGYAPKAAFDWIRYTGGSPSPHGADPTGHSLYLREKEPDVYSRAEYFLEPIDYLGMRLTGRVAATQASMIGSWLTDNRVKGNGQYVPSLVRRSQRDSARLPELIPSTSILGGLRPEVAVELDLPAGIPVIDGAPDLHTAWLGSGAVKPFDAHVSISTTAWISAAVPFKKTDIAHSIASVPGLTPGTYLIANNHETAGECLRWFKDHFMGGPLSDNAPTYEMLTEAAAAVPAGSNGVFFTPWLNGERSPVDNRNLRASFLNLSITTDRATLARAVLEGVAFNARWLLDYVEKFAKRELSTLRILGGGAQSDLWCQIHADILNRRIERPENAMHTNLRGVAFNIALALGELELDEIPALVKIDAHFEPNPANRKTYEPMYGEFRKIYRSQKKMFKRLGHVG